MFECEIVDKYTAKFESEFENPYLRVYFYDIANGLRGLAESAYTRKPMDFVKYAKYSGARNAYKVFSQSSPFDGRSLFTAINPKNKGASKEQILNDMATNIASKILEQPIDFANSLLIKQQEFRKFDELMDAFMKEMSKEYSSLIPEEERTSLPYGISVSIDREDVVQMCNDYLAPSSPELTSSINREKYENEILPKMKKYLESLIDSIGDESIKETLSNMPLPDWDGLVEFTKSITEKTADGYIEAIRDLTNKSGLKGEENYEEV